MWIDNINGLIKLSWRIIIDVEKRRGTDRL